MGTTKRLLALLLVFTMVLGTLWIPTMAATAEATLTVTSEGGTTSTYSGTYEAMATKVETLSKTLPTVKTEYVITLNSNASATTNGGFTGNEFTFVKVNLNGYTLDTSAANNMVYTLYGSVNFTLDGANAKGESGKIINHGHSGGLIYTQNNEEYNGIVANVMNVDYTATNMSQGYSTGQYKDQPMCHVNRGTVNLTNVKMTYTGENAYAVEGSKGGSDITQMTMRFIQVAGAGVMNIDGCEFINTDTQGINVRGIDIWSSAKVNVKNTKIVAKAGVVVSGSAVATVENCDIRGTNNAFGGNSKIYVTDTVIRTDTGVVCNNTAATLELRSSGDGETVIYSDAALSGTYTVAEGFDLVQTETGVYKVVSNGKVGATLSVVPKGGTPSYYSGTYQEMHSQLKTLIGTASAVDTDYTLVLYSDFVSSSSNNFSSQSTATANVRIDLNGHQLTISGVNNNIFQITGTTTGYLNFEIDGADASGKSGKLICTDLAGGLVYTRKNDGLNANTTVSITNLEATYTNMAQGYANGSTNPNQPMMHLPAGKVYLNNLKMIYTGEDATALEGKSLGDMVTPFIQCNGAELTVENCEFIDTNTKGIKTRALAVSGGSNVTVNNTKIKTFYGVVAGEGTSVELTDCDVEGTYATYNGKGVIKVIDTVSRVPANGNLATATSALYFLYGQGKNTVYSENEYTGTHTVQTGYTFAAASTGVYTMKEDTSVEATLAIRRRTYLYYRRL